jgi:hypothetical protein
VSALDDIAAAIAAIGRAITYEAEQYVVSPREYAWISNPVGEPPTTNAVMVAWKTGAIDETHPAAAALLARARGGQDQEERRSGS